MRTNGVPKTKVHTAISIDQIAGFLEHSKKLGADWVVVRKNPRDRTVQINFLQVPRSYDEEKDVIEPDFGRAKRLASLECGYGMWRWNPRADAQA